MAFGRQAKKFSLHPGLLATMPVGSQGTVGAELPQHPRAAASMQRSWDGTQKGVLFLHSMDRLLDYTTTWTFGPAITRRITLPCLVQGDRQQERGRARVHGGPGGGGRGRHSAALLQRTAGLGEGPHCQHWRSARGWACRPLGDLSQADGAQAEFEAISLHEAREGGPSALSHLELGVVWLSLWIRSGTDTETSPLGRVSPCAPPPWWPLAKEASAGLGWVEDETWGCSDASSVPYSRLLRTGCDEISMSWVVFQGPRGSLPGGWRWRISRGMLLAGLTCRVDVSALRLARHQSLLCSRISNSNHSFHSPTQGGALHSGLSSLV